MLQFIDGRLLGNNSRFVNHSHEPNLNAVPGFDVLFTNNGMHIHISHVKCRDMVVDGKLQRYIGLTPRKPINPYDELTFDYVCYQLIQKLVLNLMAVFV